MTTFVTFFSFFLRLCNILYKKQDSICKMMSENCFHWICFYNCFYCFIVSLFWGENEYCYYDSLHLSRLLHSGLQSTKKLLTPNVCCMWNSHIWIIWLELNLECFSYFESKECFAKASVITSANHKSQSQDKHTGLCVINEYRDTLM